MATSGAGAITLTTAKTISLVSGSSLKAVNGNITLSANQQATATTGTFAGVSVTGATVQTTGTGTITLQGTGGNSGTGNYGIFLSGGTVASGAALTMLGAAADGATPAVHFDSAATASSGGTAGVSITADSLEIADASSTINAGSGTATITPRTAGTLINLGGADVLGGTPLTLGLTAAELNSVTAGTLVIGSAASGAITVSANITRSASTAMQLASGGDISISGGQINTDGGTLQLSPGATGSVKPTEAGVDVTASTTSFVSGSNFTANLSGTTVDTQYTQLNVAGTVNLTGSYLLLSGSYVPNPGDTFTIVSATQINGTFNNYPNSGADLFQQHNAATELHGHGRDADRCQHRPDDGQRREHQRGESRNRPCRCGLRLPAFPRHQRARELLQPSFGGEFHFAIPHHVHAHRNRRDLQRAHHANYLQHCHGSQFQPRQRRPGWNQRHPPDLFHHWR